MGSCVPEKVLTNNDLEKMVDTSDEWIIKRTGISERRILEDNEPTYKLGVEAAKRAIEDSGLRPDEIDLIIVTSSTPDYLTPATSCLIQRDTGAVKAAAFDLVAACTGFIYGLTVAQQFIENGSCRHILVVSSEAMSKVTQWKDRNTCVLFGDGAGAVVLGPVEDGYGIISSYIDADGTQGNCISIPCLHVPEADVERRADYENKRTIWQDGQEVFKFAVKIMPMATEKVLTDSGIKAEDLKYIIPHQANIRIIDSAARRLGVESDKIYTTIKKYGNISSASIPVALADAYQEKCLEKGDYLVFVGFGGGLTWGATLLRWSK